MRSVWLMFGLAASVGVLCAVAFSVHTGPAAGRGRGGFAPLHGVEEPVGLVAIGGGATPESTEVSLEQDLALVRQVFDTDVRVLFGGGPGARTVRLTDPSIDGNDLLVRLGDLFAPRAGRRSRYRASRLPMAGPASLAEVERHLKRALKSGREPLYVYIATHGEQGDERSENWAVLWGGEALTVGRVAHLHDRASRPMVAIVTSCYSGGFAELAFRGGDPKQGPTQTTRCGLFSGPWDRPTSGCDPDPDRRKQDSYSVHMLNALNGLDRDGESPLASHLDADGDGRVSLLEAHTRARIRSVSIDVPTTTSERFLRAVQASGADSPADFLPEERAVVEQLGELLGVRDATEAGKRNAVLRAELEAVDAALASSERSYDEHYRSLAARLLAAYPVLDDAYHPAFRPTIDAHGDAIGVLLSNSAEARAYATTQRRLEQLDRKLVALQVREARLLRYMRAHETQRLAAALRARGGPDFAAYRRLLACERTVPPTSKDR